MGTPQANSEEVKEFWEHRFNQLFNTIREYGYVISPDGHIQDVNPAVCELLGYEKEELIGKPFPEIYAPESRKKMRDLLEKKKSTGKVRNEEMVVVTKQGEMRTVLLNTGSVLDVRGNFDDSASVVQVDITERKEFERRLKFERLFSELSRTFISLPVEEIDANIESTLARIGGFLKMDRIALLEFSAGRTELVATHLWNAQRVRKAPHSVTPNDMPWWWDRISRGEVVLASQLSDLPEEAIAEREYLHRGGIVSVATIPLKVSGEVNGAISFAAAKRQMSWTEDLVKQLRVIGEILCNAMERKRAIEALLLARSLVRESEERFRIMVNTAPIMIWMTGIDKLCVYFNRIWLEFTGRSLEEELGFGWADGVHPEDLEKTLKTAAKAFDRHRPFQVEYRLRRRDGQYRWILATGIPRFDAAGSFAGYIGSAIDMTERNVAGQTQRRLSAIVESSDDAIVAKDMHGVITAWNPAAQRMFGYKPEEALGRPITIIVPPELLGEEDEIMRRLRAGEHIGHFETRRKSKEGKIFDVSLTISPIKDARGRIIGASKIARDITEAKRAIAALRESEQRFRTLVNATPVMIWMSGLDKLSVYFNHIWLEFTGRSLEQELGNGWADGVHPEDLERCLKTYVEAFDRREPFQTEIRLRRHDGEYRWVLDSGAPRFNADGSFVGYIGSCVDITERRLAEEALAAANQRYIEAQEQERSRLARELHDDINQRIALLAFNLDRVKNDLPVQQAKLRERVAGECERVSQLASDIQALSHRLHSSKLEYLGLEAAAKGYCTEVTELANVEVDFRAHDVPKELSKQTSLSLFRVLQEALQNAVKHSGSKKFQVVLSGSSDQMELTVRDWGTGFTVEDKIKGRGLGLTSMRERMKLAGGQLSIQSEPGAGTTICATAPLHATTRGPVDIRSEFLASRTAALKAVRRSA